MVKELKIEWIKNGTVLDHLKAGSGLSVIRILGITSNSNTTISYLMNVSSKSMGRKDLLKIENRALKADETNKLALIAPSTTISIIKNYKVVKKNRVKLPRELVGAVRCGNPSCITNHGEPALPVFKVESQKPVRLQCKFCERVLEGDEIEDYV